MRWKQSATFCAVALAATLLWSASGFGDEFKLKTGARGAVCLGCHTAIQEQLKRPFVHTPLTEGDCTGCHNPHAAKHGKLLDEDPDRICASCHGEMAPEGAKSRHAVVAQGKCTACHDPHAADYEANLRKGGNELCFSCHTDMKKAVAEAKFQHAPVEEGCLECHDAHASKENAFILKQGVPNLCNDCHDTQKEAFVAQHAGYPVGSGRCTSCHDPHGSQQPTILYDQVHHPVANRMCNQCHNEPTSAQPFGLKREGFELCKGCHYEMVNGMLGKSQIHWPALTKKGCISCHAPHAARRPKLLDGAPKAVCGACHSDTLERGNASPTKHPPVADGECLDCHSPHSSDEPLLLTGTSVINLCGNCHDWQAHSSHPIGEDKTDPRNPNRHLDCLSCHRSHGTEYKKMIPFETQSVLCTQCHQQFKR